MLSTFRRELKDTNALCCLNLGWDRVLVLIICPRVESGLVCDEWMHNDIHLLIEVFYDATNVIPCNDLWPWRVGYLVIFLLGIVAHSLMSFRSPVAGRLSKPPALARWCRVMDGFCREVDLYAMLSWSVISLFHQISHHLHMLARKRKSKICHRKALCFTTQDGSMFIDSLALNFS